MVVADGRLRHDAAHRGGRLGDGVGTKVDYPGHHRRPSVSGQPIITFRFCTQAPAAQLSPTVHGLPSEHAPSTASCLQPVPTTQLSAVQGLPSSQVDSSVRPSQSSSRPLQISAAGALAEQGDKPLAEQDRLPVAQELQIVRSYLDIMQARLGSRLTWSVETADVPDAVLGEAPAARLADSVLGIDRTNDISGLARMAVPLAEMRV